MTTLITGASGFVGLNVAEALIARGDRVVLFALHDPPDAALREFDRLPGQYEVARGDVRSPERMTELVAKHTPEKIVHAAAVTPGPTMEGPLARTAVEVNVMGTLNVLEAARAAGVGRFVFLSSGAVYGGQAFGPGTLSEAETLPDPEGLYPVTKLAAEKIALRHAALFGLDVVAARLGAVFGPWERDTGVRETLSPVLQATLCALRGEPAVLPRPGRRDWVYARDVAAAVLLLLDAPALPHRLYNVSAGREWSVEAWCARLTDAYPGFSFRLAGEGEAANVDYFGDRDRSPLEVARLRRDLGFAARFDLDAAFADYMDWLGKHAAVVTAAAGGTRAPC